MHSNSIIILLEIQPISVQAPRPLTHVHQLQSFFHREPSSQTLAGMGALSPPAHIGGKKINNEIRNG